MGLGATAVILSHFSGVLPMDWQSESEATGEDLAGLCVCLQTTYRAVMKPVEGTMLTVARVASEAAEEAAEEGKDAAGVIRAALLGAQQALADTPNLLPVLKEAGVVDAGGQGLLCIFEGFWAGLTTAPEELEVLLAEQLEVSTKPVEAVRSKEVLVINLHEFIILGEGRREKVRTELESQTSDWSAMTCTSAHPHCHPGQIYILGELGN